MTKTIQIQLDKGLEARMVAILVQLASKFESKVYMEADTKKVNAKSIMGMMSLNLAIGDEVTVIAEGIDEQEAVVEIDRFLVEGTM